MSNEQKIYRLEEVKKHREIEDVWVAIHNSVYNVSDFLNEVSMVHVLVIFSEL